MEIVQLDKLIDFKFVGIIQYGSYNMMEMIEKQIYKFNFDVVILKIVNISQPCNIA
jgi:hypothetical protein